MNGKGVFITFMVLLLVASVLLLYDAAKRTDFRQERKHIEESAFNKVNNAFNNLYEEMVSLTKEGYAKKVQQRPMPFGYDFNSNSIILSQRVPVRVSLFRAYIDALNIYRIFAEAQVADLRIDANAIQDSKWETSAPVYTDLNYAILPQCLLYDLNAGNLDVNYMVLKALQVGELGCVSGFDYDNIKIVDVNIFINSSGCNLGGYGGTLNKSEDYSHSNPNPYFRITVNEVNPECPGTGCKVTANGKDLKQGHFNPETYDPASEIDALLVDCDSDGWLRIKLGKESQDDPYPIVVYNFIETKPAEVDLNIVFSSRVELFYFTGFDVSVEKKNFPIKRST